MFVCVARVTLDIPAAGSLKAKRQVLRRVTDRVKAKFNVAVAEVDDNEAWSRAVVGLAVVANERRHVSEMMNKIVQFMDDIYIAPVAHKELEVVPFADILSGGASLSEEFRHLTVPRGERSLAEAEGLGSWEDRHRAVAPPAPSAPRPKGSQKKREVNLDEARAQARNLRNRRDWEKD